MKNMAKRIMALVLAVAMMVTSLPTIASAASVHTIYGKDTTYKIDRGLFDGVLKNEQSTNTSVVTISRNDNVYKDIIVKAVGIGSAQVKWEERRFGTDKHTENFEVKEALANMNVSGIPSTMYVNDEATANVTINAVDNKGNRVAGFFNAPTYTITSSDATVVSVESDKLKALKAGKATITVSATNGLTGANAVNVESQTFEIEVKVPGVVSVNIPNKTNNVTMGEEFDLTANVVTDKESVSKEVVWTSTNPAAATIDENGHVVTVYAGTTTIKATSAIDSSKFDEYELTVKYDNNFGDSNWETIAVKVVDTQGNPIEGAIVTLTLRDYDVIGKDEYDSFTGRGTDNNGLQYFKIDGYEWVAYVEASKEGYISKVDTYAGRNKSKYPHNLIFDEDAIGFFKANHKNIEIELEQVIKHDVTFKYVDQANQIDHEIDKVQVSEGSKVSENALAAAEDAAKAYAEELNKLNEDYKYEFSGFEPDITDTEINDDTVVLATYEKTYVGEEIAFVNYTTQSGMTAPENEIRDLRQTKAIGNIAATLTDKDGRVYENVKVLCDGKVVAHFDLETQTLVTDPEFAARELNYKETIVLDVEIDDEIVFVDQKLRLNNVFYDFYLVDGTKVEGQYVEANADYAKDNYAEYGKDYTKLGYLLSSKANLNKVSDTWYIVSYQALKVNVNYVEDEKKETLKESAFVVVPFNTKVASNNKHTEAQMRKYAQVEALVLNTLEANDKQWALKETEYTNGHLLGSAGWNNNTITCVYTRHFEEPVELVHELWFNCDGLYKTEVEISRKTVEGKEIEQKDTVLETYKPYALEDYILDETYLKEDAITTNADGSKTVTFRYWASAIKWNYNCETVQNIKFGSSKVFKYDLNAFYEDYNKDKTVSLDKVKAILDSYEATGNILVGDTQYKLDSITVNSTHKEHFVDVTLNYVYDKASKCDHKCTHHFVDVDNTNHQEICDNCETELGLKAHTYKDSVKAGTVCVDCGHERGIEETIKATSKALWDFSDETMTRILGETLEELEDKTDDYFKEKFPDEIFAGAELPQDLLTLVEDNANSRKYEGAQVVNGVYFDYIFECSLLSGGSGSGNRGTRIGEGPVAQGSELLNDLRLDRPNDLITRAEFVGVLANLFQVPEDRIYDKAWNLEECTQREQIERLATYFIVKGYSDEEFGQNDIITIEQVYTILTRALQFQQKVKAMTNEEIEAEIAKANYVAEVSDWAKEGVSVAIKVGIAAATETNPTEPQNGVMRITAADTLQKYLEVVAAPNAEAEVKVEE